MSNEFSKFVAGVRLHARAADSIGNRTGIAWRGSQGRPSGRPAGLAKTVAKCALGSMSRTTRAVSPVSTRLNRPTISSLFS